MIRIERGNKPASRPVSHEVLAVVLIAIAVLLLLSLVTYNPRDLSWNSSGPAHPPSNLIGRLGAYTSDFFIQLFGLASFSIPILMMAIAIRTLFGSGPALPTRKMAGSAFLLTALSGFLALFPEMGLSLLRNSHNGGVVGYLVEGGLAHLMNTAGAAIVLSATTLLTLMLAMDISLHGFWSALSTAASHLPGIRQHDRTLPGARTEPKEGLLLRWRRFLAARAEARRARILAKLRVQRQARASISESPSATAQRATGLAPEVSPAGEISIAKAGAAGSLAGVSIEYSPGSPIGSVQNSTNLQPAAQTLGPGGELTISRSYGKADDASGMVPSRKTSPRAEAREAVKAHHAKLGGPPPDITMDPEVAEMVSTASIVRTLDGIGAGSRAGAPKPQTRKQSARQDAVDGYKLPALDLLETPIGHREQAEDELRERATILAEKCKEFAVIGHIHRINPGPVVTTFEFKPDPGIKYSRVVSLADDLCLALKAESIRIDRIPGKSTVGIEVPNAHREKILLREVIESPKFGNSESKLLVALGKTINGEEYVADLTKMPHLLIAGATGAGKSVTLNGIICSILYKASPVEVKFIMVDPKRLELGLYEGIPHLLTPIVTEPKRAANALKWAVNEMENRYRELAKFGVRNIDQYNQLVRESTHPTLWADDPNSPRQLPFIVITIDELADLMMIARGDVETSIARLAQMARAVGIHLVVATQRPSVDVITGVIKANFPSRIAFRVSSKVDSRTIIDSNGAEGLLGQGDMLFLPPASSRLVRVHGSFVNEQEIQRITDHHRTQAQPDYNEQVTQSDQDAEGVDDVSGELDELFDEALAIVTDMGRASTSVLQRRLSIGYGRAAKILDLMERGGFIGPVDGAKPRKVLQAAYEFRERLSERIEEGGL
jgi:S-DNA-T family DNA segregation ATPase FtsK/SpoIIIE